MARSAHSQSNSVVGHDLPNVGPIFRRFRATQLLSDGHSSYRFLFWVLGTLGRELGQEGYFEHQESD